MPAQVSPIDLLLKGLESGEIDIDEAEDFALDYAADLVEDDVLNFGLYYFPDMFTLDFCAELHEYFVEIKEEEKTSTLAPRGHAKTTIKCFLIPLYLALKYPERYQHYVNVQATTAKAIAVNISIKTELESNEALIRDFGPQYPEKKRGGTRWTEKQFVLRNGVVFTAIGAGESFRGKNWRNKRPDYIIVDDLYDDKDIENPDNIAKKNNWFWSTLYKSRAIGRKTCIHVQGTAIHDTDLMHTLSNLEDWKFRKFVACDFDTGFVLWKEANTLETLSQDREAMGSIIFNREMLNEPRDESTAIIKTHHIQYVDDMDAVDVDFVLGAIDPAEKEKEINDFTAKVALYVTKNRDIYIADIRNSKISFHKNKLDIIDFHEKHDFTKVPFETNKHYGLYQELKRTTSVPVVERIADKDKITRLIAVSAFFENGKVFFVKNSLDKKLMNEAVKQLTTNFPLHDDIRDAIVLGMEEVKALRKTFVG